MAAFRSYYNFISFVPMLTIEELLSERDTLLQQVQLLQRENQVLRERLGMEQDETISLLPTPSAQPHQLSLNSLSNEEKITLFRSLFKGRDDAQTKNQLEMVGFRLQIMPTNSLRAVVIDRRTIWYGGINYLSNSIAEDNAMRLTDSSVAENLLNILL